MTSVPTTIAADSPEGQATNIALNLATAIRGPFLDQAIWLDLLTGDILGLYFCPDAERRKLLFSEIFSGAASGLNRNIRVLSKVVKHSFPSFAQQHPNLLSTLDNIRKFRNVLAHAHLDTSDDWTSQKLKDRIRVVYYKDGKTETRVITVEESNRMLGQCSTVLLQLSYLQQLVISNPAQL